jgi:CubicO group peptidase (beta-lactamase class C family)
MSYGTCISELTPLRSAFDESLLADGKGAALTVCIDGEVVVDLWGGEAHECTEWGETTRAVVFSSGKAVAALATLRLVDAGQLELDRPVSAYWPEFAAAGKQAVTVADVLTHAAGVPYWKGMESFVEFGTGRTWPDSRDAAERLAAAEPVIRPHVDMAYHALTYGWLVDELVLRVTGTGLQELVAAEISEPLGLRFSYGAADSDVVALTLRPLESSVHESVVRAYAPSAPGGIVLGINENGGIFGVAEVATSPSFLAACQPAVNGVTDARSLARLYGVIACGGDHHGVRLLQAATLRDAIVVQRVGSDVLTGDRLAFGWGLLRYGDAGFPGLPSAAVGHPGLGGSLAFADPERRVSFAYVPGALELDLEREHERATKLVVTLYNLIASHGMTGLVS